MEFNYNFPKIMGIINITPDSFSDGGLHLDKTLAVEYALKMVQKGVDIIDIGGESTRPGAVEIDVQTEINRVIPVIEAIRNVNKDITISIDTTKSEVALAAIESGANIINDISGLTFDEKILQIASDYDVYLIIMHILGKPRTMQQNPVYKNVVLDIFYYLIEKISFARMNNVNKIIADVGIGFGKTLEHNLELLKNLNKFKELGVPILLGISRKTFIGKITDIENPSDRDLPTYLYHALLLNSGADIIRVHNVDYAIMLKKIFYSLEIK